MRRWLRFIVSILAVPIVGLTTLASSSAQVVPPVATPTDGVGSDRIVVDATRQMVCFALHATNVEQPTAAHIHEGAVGVAGPIVVPLAAPVDGNVSGCTPDVDREVLSRLIQTPAGFYVNVHNAEFPAGAVRGQLGR
jgi:hypothetical protein